MPTPSQQATNICQLCHSQGHYDYQCQFAGEFMAHTQKAFNQGRSYSHQDPNHGEWSQGENDNNDPNGQRKTEGQNGISRLISALCVNCLSSIPEYSRLNYLDEYLV